MAFTLRCARDTRAPNYVGSCAFHASIKRDRSGGWASQLTVVEGICTHGCALRVQMWPTGSSQVVSSSVPGLTIVAFGLCSGLWNKRAPQSLQKKHQITRSLATTRRHLAGVPLTTASASRATASE